MPDNFASYSTGLDSPAYDAASVTPSDSTELPVYSRALYIGTGGTLKVKTVGGTDVTFTNVPNASLLQVRCKLVWSTGTTASDIINLF